MEKNNYTLEQIRGIVPELVSNKKYNELRLIFTSMEPVDIAELFAEFNNHNLLILFRILPKELAAETFVEMDTDEQEFLINAFSEQELKEVVEELFVDDAVNIIEEMPANVVKRILNHTDSKKRSFINEILQYPKNSAGSVMTIEYVSLKPNMTVAEAFDKIRKTGVDKETIYTCYVTDPSSRKLLGLVSVRDLLLSDYNMIIDSIMETNIISVETLQDKEDVANMFDKYDFISLPVVDKENRLVGIITFDDAIDIIQEENTEDIQKMSAMAPTDEQYLKTSIWNHSKNRIIWLLFLMLSATITGSIIQYYEDAFTALPILVAFIPMLMGTGGNCGSQSSTMIIRSLALDEVSPKDIIKILFKEFRIALLVGVMLALVNAVRVYIMFFDENPLYLSITTGLSLIGTVILAKMLGGILPIIAKKCHLDPAIMASPLITTVVDTCSIIVFFNVALWVMTWGLI